jgi:tRNA (guanine-N7-)-methyltransferase
METHIHTYPYSFKDRRPVLDGNVLFVPKFYDSHQSFVMPKFSDLSVFYPHKRVVVEFCSGNGEWIAERAFEDPETLYVAVEIQLRRAKLIHKKAQKRILPNLFTIVGDAKDVVNFYFHDTSIDGVHINFPDPWPKTKHHKHRIIQEDFVRKVKSKMKKGGEFIFVSDDKPYIDWSMDILGDVFEKDTTYSETDTNKYGTSFFSSMFEEQGKPLYKLRFVNDSK